jgi:hypothetical protein
MLFWTASLRLARIHERAGRPAVRKTKSYQFKRLRPIAIDTAAWLGSTTGRPTWR